MINGSRSGVDVGGDDCVWLFFVVFIVHVVYTVGNHLVDRKIKYYNTYRELETHLPALVSFCPHTRLIAHILGS